MQFFHPLNASFHFYDIFTKIGGKCSSFLTPSISLSLSLFLLLILLLFNTVLLYACLIARAFHITNRLWWYTLMPPLHNRPYCDEPSVLQLKCNEIGKRDRDSAKTFDAWVQMKATDFIQSLGKLLRRWAHIRLIECNPFVV